MRVARGDLIAPVPIDRVLQRNFKVQKMSSAASPNPNDKRPTLSLVSPTDVVDSSRKWSGADAEADIAKIPLLLMSGVESSITAGEVTTKSVEDGRVMGPSLLKPPEPKSFRVSALFWLGGIMLLSVPMVTLIDVPVARWFATKPMSREVGDVLNLMQVVSHGSGIIMILLAIFMLAPRLRWHLPRLATLAMGAGAVATLAKMFVLRPRPNGLNLEVARHDSAWLWAFDWNLSQVAAFDASTRAFPSGNVATAIALTVGLWVVLPRGRWLFATMCLGTILQRLYFEAHFVSDAVGGAAFGLLWSYFCMHPHLLGSLFDKMQPERKRRRRRDDHSRSDPPQVSRAA